MLLDFPWHMLKELYVLVISLFDSFFYHNHKIWHSTMKLCVVAKYASRLEHTKSHSIIGCENTRAVTRGYRKCTVRYPKVSKVILGQVWNFKTSVQYVWNLFDRNKKNSSLFIGKDVRKANTRIVTVIDTTVYIKPLFWQDNNIFRPIYNAPASLIFDVLTNLFSLSVFIC